MKRGSRTLAVVLAAALVAGYAIPAITQDVKMISPDELKKTLGSPDLVVIDVRSAGDWDSSDLKIQDAVREDPANVASWVEKYPKDRSLVFYCA
ncbi:MAG: hypothetical protein KKE57_11905 [Proteobacteria bacterium]|nr:hypothetical protein [Pseudomonadota bacterium]